MQQADVIVIGAGPAGEVAAERAVRGSDRTAVLVEAELLGGECSYYACMPSKALLRPLDVAHAAAHLEGVSTPDVEPDALLARRDTWVSGYDDAGQVGWAEGAGLRVVRGTGRLVGERTVEVTGADGAVERFEAREAVVLATGSTAVIPEALAGVMPWMSRDATGIAEIPERIAVVGGGVVACEAATWLAALGSRVALLVRGDRLLAAAEPFAGELVADGLRAAGVEVRLGVSVTAARRDDARDTGLGRLHGGPVTVTLDSGDELEVSEVLIATGRRPALDDVGLDTIGLRPDRITADGGRVHGAPLPEWLHVVGDASGGPALTHWGKFQARRVGQFIADRAEGRTPSDPAAEGPVPQVVFTDPQVAWVGLTVEGAAGAGLEVRALDTDLGAVAGTSLLRDDAAGRARLVVDERDRLVGATFVGPEVAELLHAATVAVTAGLDLDTLRRAVPAYPTASEVWVNLLDT